MSEAKSPGVEPEDHRELVAYVVMTKAHGSDRRLHRADGDPAEGTLSNGEERDPACNTSLTSGRSTWIAKPAGVFPPGYFPLCQSEECFGEADDPDPDGQ